MSLEGDDFKNAQWHGKNSAAFVYQGGDVLTSFGCSQMSRPKTMRRDKNSTGISTRNLVCMGLECFGEQAEQWKVTERLGGSQDVRQHC